MKKNFDELYIYCQLIVPKNEKENFYRVQNNPYIDQIRKAKRIREIINNNRNYYAYGETEQIERLFSNMKKSFPDASKSILNLNAYVNYIYYIKDEIYKKIPIPNLSPEKDFNIEGSKKQNKEIERMIQITNFTDLEDLYKLSKLNNITEIYNFYTKEEKTKQTRLSNKILVGLKETIRVFNDIEMINKFNRIYTKEELVRLSDEEYNKLINDTRIEISKYQEMLKENKDMKIYMEIFIKYRENFSSKFSESIEEISSRVNYLKSLHLERKITDLYMMSDEELNKLKQREDKERKIEFIMRHDEVYKKEVEPLEDIIKMQNDAGLRNLQKQLELSTMSEDEFNKIYMRNYLKFVNENNSKYKDDKMTEYLYMNMSEDERKEELNNTYNERRLRSIVRDINIIRKDSYKKQITYEELKEMNSKDLMELELEVFSYHERERRRIEREKGSKK